LRGRHFNFSSQPTGLGIIRMECTNHVATRWPPERSGGLIYSGLRLVQARTFSMLICGTNRGETVSKMLRVTNGFPAFLCSTQLSRFYPLRCFQRNYSLEQKDPL
jgi:hypothetical protein